MPPPEQAELWMALRKRMKVANWGEMTLQEKKAGGCLLYFIYNRTFLGCWKASRKQLKLTSHAAYWIAFGPHGPRAQDPPGENMRVLGYSALGIAVSFVIFVTIRAFAKPPPKTMTKEWQEMTNEYLKVGLFVFLLDSVGLGLLRTSRNLEPAPHSRRDHAGVALDKADPVGANIYHRHKTPNPSQVSHHQAMLAKAQSKALPKRRPNFLMYSSSTPL